MDFKFIIQIWKLILKRMGNQRGKVKIDVNVALPFNFVSPPSATFWISWSLKRLFWENEIEGVAVI